MLIASVGAHALFGAVLAILPSVSSVGARQEQIVEVFFETSVPAPMVAPAVVPEPVIVPEPEPEAPPEPVVEVRRERAIPEPMPAPVAAAIAPAPSAPPSIDDVFGEPPPALPSLTAAGGGDFAVSAGSPDGAAGGTHGGRGRTIGASAGSGHGTGEGVSGPSPDDIRRARRAYANRIRDLLGGVARYPIPARRGGIEGRVVVALRISDRGGIEGRVVVALRISDDGRLIAARVRSSCGYAMLDEAALAAANDLSRVPAPPALVAWNAGEELTVPIVFELSR